MQDILTPVLGDYRQVSCNRHSILTIPSAQAIAIAVFTTAPLSLKLVKLSLHLHVYPAPLQGAVAGLSSFLEAHSHWHHVHSPLFATSVQACKHLSVLSRFFFQLREFLGKMLNSSNHTMLCSALSNQCLLLRSILGIWPSLFAPRFHFKNSSCSNWVGSSNRRGWNRLREWTLSSQYSAMHRGVVFNWWVQSSWVNNLWFSFDHENHEIITPRKLPGSRNGCGNYNICLHAWCPHNTIWQ